MGFVRQSTSAISGNGLGVRSVLVVCFQLLVADVMLTDAWPSSLHLNRRDDDQIPYAKHSRRSSYCVAAAGKCFSSNQCCRGLVCAAIDDYFGQKPEVPGYCVKEKDLEVCATNADCGTYGRCVALGRTGERYCLPRPSNGSPEALQEIGEIAAPVAAVVPASAALMKGPGGLGAQCEYNGDCRPLMDNGIDKLCCQDVRRGRQGVRRICDRVTPISACITSPLK